MATLVTPRHILARVRLIKIPEQGEVVTSEKFFRERGVVGMSQNFMDYYVGLQIAPTGPKSVVVRQLNREFSDVELRFVRSSSGPISMADLAYVLWFTSNSRAQILGYAESRKHSLCAVVASYIHGPLVGWSADVRPPKGKKDKSKWSSSTLLVTSI